MYFVKRQIKINNCNLIIQGPWVYVCVCADKKRSYHRKIIAALNYEIQQMSFIPPFPSTQIISPVNNSRISANHDKVEILSANCEILIEGVVSLL